MNSISIKQKLEDDIISEAQYQAMKLKKLQSALIEGKQSNEN